MITTILRQIDYLKGIYKYIKLLSRRWWEYRNFVLMYFKGNLNIPLFSKTLKYNLLANTKYLVALSSVTRWKTTVNYINSSVLPLLTLTPLTSPK